MAQAEKVCVSTSGQVSSRNAVRHRWNLEKEGRVEVLDLGFGVLTVPIGCAGRLLNQMPPVDTHLAAFGRVSGYGRDQMLQLAAEHGG